MIANGDGYLGRSLGAERARVVAGIVGNRIGNVGYNRIDSGRVEYVGLACEEGDCNATAELTIGIGGVKRIDHSIAVKLFISRAVGAEPCGYCEGIVTGGKSCEADLGVPRIGEGVCNLNADAVIGCRGLGGAAGGRLLYRHGKGNRLATDADFYGITSHGTAVNADCAAKYPGVKVGR